MNCFQVLWAGLYWGAENRSGGSNYATRNQCRIKVNSGTYTNLTADAFTATKIMLSWDVIPNAAGYQIYYKPTAAPAQKAKAVKFSGASK